MKNGSDLRQVYMPSGDYVQNRKIGTWCHSTTPGTKGKEKA